MALVAPGIAFGKVHHQTQVVLDEGVCCHRLLLPRFV